MDTEEIDSSLAERISVMISAEEIALRRREIAAQISADFAGKQLVMICVLKGSMPFFVDLTREIDLPVRYEFVGVSSYVDGTESSGEPRITTDLEASIAGEHVLLVEDIVDTGSTIRFLHDRYAALNPASLGVVALLDKPERRLVDVDVDYTGFVIPNEFVVGYGLDYAQRFRNLPYIGVLSLDD